MKGDYPIATEPSNPVNRAIPSEIRGQLSGAESHPEWVALLQGEILLYVVPAPHGNVIVDIDLK